MEISVKKHRTAGGAKYRCKMENNLGFWGKARRRISVGTSALVRDYRYHGIEN
jgi:hypothetical protein